MNQFGRILVIVSLFMPMGIDCAYAQATNPSLTPGVVTAPAVTVPSVPASSTSSNSPAASVPPAPVQAVVLRPDYSAYARLDFKAMFDLFWKSGLVETVNKKAVTEYLQSTQCDVYKNTYKNDFVWPDVLRTTSEYIDTYKKDFPSQFLVIQPIALDRYDPEKEWFTLSSDTQYLNVTQMVVADFLDMNPLCVGVPLPQEIPRRMMLRIPSPFSLTYLPMKRDFAKSFIEMMEQQKKGMLILNEKRERYAFVFFYYSITGLDLEQNNKQIANFIGKLDGYEVYADIAGTVPLFRGNKQGDE